MFTNKIIAHDQLRLIAPTANLPKLIVGQPALLKKFTLNEIGIDTQKLVANLSPTFESLPVDSYHKKFRQVQFLKKHFPESIERLNIFLLNYYASDTAIRLIDDLLNKLSVSLRQEFDSIQSQRKRTIARFRIDVIGDRIWIKRIKAGAFKQMNVPADHPLAFPRYFEEASTKLTDDEGVKKLLRFVAREVAATGAKAMEVVLHQVMMHASCNEPFTLPDGIHQDGADFIVSAVPVVLESVKTPLSTVYDLNKVPVTTEQLKVGEGLLHDDHDWWHSVSDLYATQTKGRRGTIGLDVHVLL